MTPVPTRTLALAAALAGCVGRDEAGVEARRIRVEAAAASLRQAEAAAPAWEKWLRTARAHRADTCDTNGNCLAEEEHASYDDVAERIADRAAPWNVAGTGPLAAVLDLDRQLRAHGIDLLVVLVPVKSAVEPDLLAPAPREGRPDLGPLRFRLALEERGVEVLDMRDVLVAAPPVELLDDTGVLRREKVYRDNDLHWTSRGASLAADAIAARLRAHPSFVAAAHEQGRLLITESTRWVTRLAGRPARRLVRLPVLDRGASRRSARSAPPRARLPRRRLRPVGRLEHADPRSPEHRAARPPRRADRHLRDLHPAAPPGRPLAEGRPLRRRPARAGERSAVRLASSLLGVVCLALAAAATAGCGKAPPVDEQLAAREARIAHIEEEVQRFEAVAPAWSAWRGEARLHDFNSCDDSGSCIFKWEKRGYDEVAASLGDPANLAGDTPLGAIVDFADQLHRHGVDLLLVVIPLKSTLYPDLIAPPPADGIARAARPDVDVLRFYEALEKHGVEVLDLYDALAAAPVVQVRDDDGTPRFDKTYRDTDNHFTSRGFSVAADAIAERIRRYPWFADVSAERGRTLTHDKTLWIEEMGNIALQPLKGRGIAKPERHLLHRVFVDGQAGGLPYDRTSPVVLIGDSFGYYESHDGRRAGMPNHLLRALGFPIDGYAFPVAAPFPTRRALHDSRPNLEGVRLVVYETYVAMFEPTAEWKRLAFFDAPAGSR